MYKVIISLNGMGRTADYGTGRYGDVLVGEDEMYSVRDKVQEKYGTKHFNIVSVHIAEPEEELLEDEPFSRRITLYAVGENFKDALRRGHIRQSQTSAMDVLRMVVRDSPDTVALGIFGFDVYVDENSNHWNA